MDKSSLIYPMFVKKKGTTSGEIPSMDGQYRYSVDCMGFELERQQCRCENVMFFGIPDQKDEVEAEPQRKWHCAESTSGSKRKISELYLITDVCMCEYTSHGHCGMLCGQ